MPEPQAAIRRMRKLKDQGLALPTIADTMTAAGMRTSRVGCCATGDVARLLQGPTRGIVALHEQR